MKNQRGFTLIELMVTIAILALVIAIATPSFSSMLLNNRIETAAQQLHGALQLARSEAVKRQERIQLCRSNEEADACENGTNWSDGWLIYAAEDDSGNESGVLRLWEGSVAVEVTGPSGGVTFFASGRADADEKEFSVTDPGCTAEQKRTLKISRLGTTQLRKTAC